MRCSPECRICALDGYTGDVPGRLVRGPEDFSPLASSTRPIASLDGFAPVPGLCPACGQPDASTGHAARLMDATLSAVNSGNVGIRHAGNSKYAHKCM